MPGSEPPSLLVLRALGLGDFLTGLPALRGLAAAYPEHRKLLVAPSALRGLARLAVPRYEVVHTTGLHSRPALEAVPEVAVNLHGRGPQSHRLLEATNAHRLMAFRHDAVPATAGCPEWPDGVHEVRRWCDLIRSFGIACDESDLLLELPAGLVDPRPEVTIVHPGAAFPARRWPAERWAQVARAEETAGRTVLLTGSRTEEGICRSVAVDAGLAGERVMAGRTGLVALAGLLAGAGRVLCADTGVAHLATALRVPSVILFGPTSPAQWGPPVDRGIHRVLWKHSTGDPHAESPDEGLLAITVEEVLKAVRELPTTRRGLAVDGAPLYS